MFTPEHKLRCRDERGRFYYVTVPEMLVVQVGQCNWCHKPVYISASPASRYELELAKLRRNGYPSHKCVGD